MQKHRYTPLTPAQDITPTKHLINSIPSSSDSQHRARGVTATRTTKTSQKLALFPEDLEITSPVETDDKYDQIGQLPQGTSRREAERFSKKERQQLPRVTAYCTAASYRPEELLKYLQSRKIQNSTAPKRFDECIYTPFTFQPSKQYTTIDLLGLDDHAITNQVEQTIPEVFFFEYGVVVIWGMKENEEKILLNELVSFEEEKLSPEDVETEEFHFHYAASYQPRIYNDVITLKNPGNYMVKLTISHAIAQSVKMTLFEELIESTIEDTKHIPQTMSKTGKVQMSRTAITQKIGQLFIVRINVNLVSNVLDTPEIFWSEPTYQPLYSAIRGYLEISQRVELLNQRVSVISEYLEWIVIVLITFEIVIGLLTIGVDVYGYSKKQ
nr:4509_t:CDS:2 [Entrophospora candida]